MSSKFDKYVTDPVIKFIDEDGVEQIYEYHRPYLNDFGQEELSDTSLVAVADLRPMSLGERVRRYMRTPQFQQDLMNQAGMDEDEDNIPDSLGDPDGPELMSPHEERAYDLRRDAALRAAEKVEADKKAETDAAIEREKAEKAVFRRRMKELRDEGSVPDEPR